LFLPRSRKLLSAFSDERLVEQIRGGNDDAFEAVFDRHHLAILSFCRHMLASADEAEDAVQQTFISAFDALRADARDIKLKPWLYTIARNRCLSILRARREQPAELDEISTAGLADEVQHRADLRDMLEDMRRLPVDQRAALVLSEIGDLSHAEVGEVVGCEAAKVKSLVFQARSSLIETRNAREIPCSEIREQLANATGGALRRGPLRRHLRACEGCSEFRDEVMRQRKALAMLLPVVPSVGFKKSALAALFGGGGGGGAGGAAVGLSGGGGLASLASSGAAVKVVGAVVVASVAVGGGIVLEKGTNAPPAEAAGKPPGAVSTPGHIRDVPGSHVRAIARHHGKRRAAAVKRGHRGKHANAQPGASTSTGTKHGGKGGAQNGAQNVPAGQTGPGAPVSQGPGATPTGPPPWSSAGGNGNGNGTPGAPGGGAQTDGGNNSGWDHSAHGGQGVGNGGTPPGTPPATTGNGNSGGNGPPPNSNAGGNGNGNANGHVNSTDG
jgi:RNA polymerase sigma factor (sigma-70 family)